MVPAEEDPAGDDTNTLLPMQVMTAAFSRFMLAAMVPSRNVEDLLLGMWLLLGRLGRVRRQLIWDNEDSIGRGRLTPCPGNRGHASHADRTAEAS